MAGSRRSNCLAQGCVYATDDCEGTSVKRATAASGGGSPTPFRRPGRPRPEGPLVRGSPEPGRRDVDADQLVLARDDVDLAVLGTMTTNPLAGLAPSSLLKLVIVNSKLGRRRAGIEGEIAHARRERCAETGQQVHGAGYRAPGVRGDIEPVESGSRPAALSEEFRR